MSQQPEPEWKKILSQMNLLIYESAFIENRIDDDSFLQISEEDLKELVPKLGPRKKLWNAIQLMKSGSIYVCYLCNKGFPSFKKLSQHLRVEHRLRSSDTYQCVHCKGLFPKQSFLNHFRNIFKLHNDIFGLSVIEGVDQVEFDTLSHIDNIHSAADELDLKGVAIKLIASILKSGKVPMSTCEEIICNAKQLVNEIIKSAKQTVSTAFDDINGDATIVIEKLDELSQVFNEFDTKYKLDQYLTKNNLIINPKSIVLDSDLVFYGQQHNRQRYSPVKMQYISIKESLLQLLKKPGFYQILDFSNSFNGDIFRSFRDGLFFHNKNFPKRTIFINIYFDEAEVANPLGSKSGKHKLSNFYFSIIDLPKHMLSSLDNILLLASVKTADMKQSSANAVVKVIVDELISLWNEGIDFDLNGEKLNVKVALAQPSGDNLGLHSILGFTEGFTANFPCRRCKMHKQECQKAVLESETQLRTIENYNADVNLNNFSMTGINFESVLNLLPYHHVTNMVVFDIMHDIFEGVGTDLVLLVVQHMINSKFVTLDKLNHRIESFDYGKHFKGSKPSIIKPGFLKGETKAGQNASQCMCLIYCLPLIVADLCPLDDKVWNIFLTFRETVEIILAPSITKSGLIYVDSLISEFCHSYQILFNKTLKPKHHHLLHYASSIELIGPLKYFWSMSFEAKHKFFKTNAHVTCNFRNIAKSVAYRHQLSRCFRLLAKVEFSPNDFNFEGYDTVVIDNLKFSNEIQNRYDLPQGSMIKITDRVTLNGLEYRCGCYVYLGNSETETVFGKVELILLEEDECNLLLSVTSAEYDEHFCSFKLRALKSTRIIDINEISYFMPLYPMQSFKLNDASTYIVLPIKFV